ncbi:MAG: adenylyl-sulfate kinase [Planctomycetes bacterium]|nr:adenylyl-sulfate kinase [Planctomycetota bacterium]
MNAPRPTPNAVPHAKRTAVDRFALLGRKGCTIWLTGIPAAGKTTIALALEDALLTAGTSCIVLDGDTLRHGLNAGLDFSDAGRAEAVRRAGEAALLIAESGSAAIVSMVSPLAADRMRVRNRHADASLAFHEVFVDAPVPVAEARDPKGHYARARSGDLPSFTGVSAPYEPPTAPALHLRTDHANVRQCVDAIRAIMTK